MAAQPTDHGGLVALPGTIAAMPAVSCILARYDRPQLAAFIEIAIGLLDTLDGPEDPDDPDFSPRSDGAPGDPQDYHTDDDREAGANVEWTSMRVAQRRQGNSLIHPGGQEDDEDDDRDTSAEDHPKGIDPEEDYGIDDVAHDVEGVQAIPSYGIDQSRGCEPPHLSEDRAIVNPHLVRIRRTRCQRVLRRGQFYGEYRLI